MKVSVQSFFDSATWTLTYLVFDEVTQDAVVIDPVWNYTPSGSVLSQTSHEQILTFIKEKKLKLHYVLETHAHADHVTGAQLFKKDFPNIKIAISERIVEVQKTFQKIFNFGNEFETTGRSFDLLLKDQSEIRAGSLCIKVISTPGHTPVCTSFLIEDALFTGDALFHADIGTGRCDFPGGDAKALYRSIHERLYKFPGSTRHYPGHDYPPATRSVRTDALLEECKKSNIQIQQNTTEADFIEFRSSRDKTLEAPKLLLPSIQMNLQAGKLPPAEANGMCYLKIPIKLK